MLRMQAIMLVWLALLAQSALASPPGTLNARSSFDYAPRAAHCPKTPLVRKADGINTEEKAYVDKRKESAMSALADWLNSTGQSFSKNVSQYPTLALSSSGGGYRAMLIGAGVHQAFDARETNVTSSLKGLYQAMTYESALSGGAWLLSSIIGNDWPTISNIRDTLWYRTLPATPLLPDQFGFLISDADIIASIAAKSLAGYDPTFIDIYGRLVAYTLLKEKNGGVKQTLSSIRQMSNYANHQFPFPIMTALQVYALQECYPTENTTQFEFTPVEYGSWDKERASFTPTEFAGSIVGSDGSQNCITGYDNLAYVLGTSSDIFPYACNALGAPLTTDAQALTNYTQSLLGRINHTPSLRDIYAPFPDTADEQVKSAKKYAPTGRSPYTETYLMDGGLAGQVNPIWPFLYRRDVDVLFVEDSDTFAQTNGYPDGSDIHTTYVQAQARGLTRMPYVPDNTTFVARGYNTRPTFFGCDEPEAMTIVYMPNNGYVYAANTSTYKLSYDKQEIDGMLANGQAVATFNGTQGYATCVGCAVMKKTGTTLPSACQDCFTKYCATL